MIKALTPQALIRAQFLRFTAVGAAGFVVDESVLAFLHAVLGLHPSSARIVSILTAMTFTWFGNRTFTFHAHAARGVPAMIGEWIKYLLTNSFGAALNYGTFLVLLTQGPAPFDNPYLATAIGVAVGMVSNFAMSRTLVFRTRPPDS